MTRILYIGMDVHTTNYTLCAYSMEEDRCFAETQVDPDVKNIMEYLFRIEKQYRKEKKCNCKFVCGYEAGCLGYSLYYELSAKDIECKIIAPSTIPTATNEKKTDRRDARKLSKCLAFNTCSYVHIPEEEDIAVKEYIRMRDDIKQSLKSTKQQILSFCTRHGKKYPGKSYWTIGHVKWIKEQSFGNAIMDETFQEYLLQYNELSAKVERLDKRIEELAKDERYAENVKKLSCFLGVKTHTALAVLSEVGDFRRFDKAEKFASFLGLVPAVHDSSDNHPRLGITKAGNSHLRRLLIEAAHSYSRGAVGHKSKALKVRQDGNDPKTISYADRANTRLRRKYYQLIIGGGKLSNVAKTAVARELACFMWGMITGNTD